MITVDQRFILQCYFGWVILNGIHIYHVKRTALTVTKSLLWGTGLA